MRSGRPILQLVEEFLANQDIMDNSRKKYRGNLRVFIVWITRNGDPRDIRRADIIRYKEHLIQSGKKAQTIDNYLTTVRQFFVWLEEVGECDNVAAGIRSPRISREFRKNHLRPDQVNALLTSIETGTLHGSRDYAIINLMVRTGMRCIEVCRMNIADIDIEEGRYVVKIQGKGRHDKDRILGITNRVVEPILQYLDIRDEHADDGHMQEDMPVFCNHAAGSNFTRVTPEFLSKMIKTRMRGVSIDDAKITAHSLRHTAAVTALRAGATINDVQQMLGHTDIKTTSVYLLSIAAAEARKGTAVRLLDNQYEFPKEMSKTGQKQSSMILSDEER